MALPFTAGRGSQGLMGQSSVHTWAAWTDGYTSQPSQLPSCMDKWAVLVPCQSRPSCVDVGSPFPRSCHSSIAGFPRLACHSTCHLTLKPETFEGQSEIQAETWAGPHHPPGCFWTLSPLCWTAWAAASRTWLLHVFTHPTSADQMAGGDWPCGHHQQISALAPFTQTVPLRASAPC